MVGGLVAALIRLGEVLFRLLRALSKGHSSHDMASEVLEDAESYYVVMEKCKGKDLHESIHGKSKLDVAEIRDVLFQILTALAELHAEGLVHKDVKLENVMLDRTPSSSTSNKQV